MFISARACEVVFSSKRFWELAPVMKVNLRIRPFNDEEILSGKDQQCIAIETESAVLMYAPRDSSTFKNSTPGVGDVNHQFTFSKVFGPETPQKIIFDKTTLGMVKDFVDGQNCLLFEDGVTNSGKVNISRCSGQCTWHKLKEGTKIGL